MTEPNDRRGLARQDFLRLLGLGAGSYALGDYAFAGSMESVSQLHNAPVQHSYILDAARTEVQLGRQRASTFAYNGMLPGPELRVKHGDHMRILVHNNLPTSTSVHWHGLPIPFHMDGVPGVTQAPIGPGTSFLYHFRAPVPGTYWYHSHSGIQNDKGLYGPLIIEPKRETLSYDREYTLMIDDWIDGIRHWSGNESDSLYTCKILPQGRTENAPRLVGTPPAQPQRYPLFLINGKPGTAPEIIDLKRGDVVRLRLINASAATTVRVAIAGHRMRVTHADGLAVDPVDVDVLEIGMAERYDVLIYGTNPGVWQLGVYVNGEGIRTRALVRYKGSHAKAPPANFEPHAFKGRLLTYEMLRASKDVATRVPSGKPDMVVPITLNARFGSFWLTFNGNILESDKPFHIPRDKHIRFVISNSGSTEVHPIHLHGKSFQLKNETGRGPMKDTVKVYPFQTVTIDWMSDNPGLWVFHCHNLYHMLGGMMQLLKVG
ncbi:MAG: multicopper oxidase MmcO [Chloroflexota bacterium]